MMRSDIQKEDKLLKNEQQTTDECIENEPDNNKTLSLPFFETAESLLEKFKRPDIQSEDLLIDFLTDEALQKFCTMNQYFSFNTKSVDELKLIFTRLNEKIKTIENQTDQQALELLTHEHNQKINDWLVQTNAFAGKMYAPNQDAVQAVACSEYAPDLQLEILQIDLNKLRQPVLDIGCGKEMNLVNYLREKEFEVYGIDRFNNDNPFYKKQDWLEYDFETQKWGSIISNLGFSNHFIHHNLRVDGNYREYARKYMEILNALQSGGSFYYAPDLPFIEKHLDRFKYECTTFDIPGSKFKASRVTRID